MACDYIFTYDTDEEKMHIINFLRINNIQTIYHGPFQSYKQKSRPQGQYFIAWTATIWSEWELMIINRWFSQYISKRVHAMTLGMQGRTRGYELTSLEALAQQP